MSRIAETVRRLFGYAKNYTPDELLNTRFRNILCVRKTKLTFIIMYYAVNLILNEIQYYDLDYNYKICVVLRVIQTISYITFGMLCTMRYKWHNYEETMCLGAHCFILEIFIKMSLLIVPIISDFYLLDYNKWKQAINSDDNNYFNNMYEHDKKIIMYLGKLLILFTPNLLITTNIMQVLQYLTNSFKNQHVPLVDSNSDDTVLLINKYDQLRKIFTIPYCTIQIFIYTLLIQILSLDSDIQNFVIPVLLFMLASTLIYAIYWPYLKWYMLAVLYLLWVTPIMYVCSKYEVFKEFYAFLLTVFNQSFIIMMLLHDMILYLFDPYDITAQYVEIA